MNLEFKNIMVENGKIKKGERVECEMCGHIASECADVIKNCDNPEITLCVNCWDAHNAMFTDTKIDENELPTCDTCGNNPIESKHATDCMACNRTLWIDHALTASKLLCKSNKALNALFEQGMIYLIDNDLVDHVISNPTQLIEEFRKLNSKDIYPQEK